VRSVAPAAFDSVAWAGSDTRACAAGSSARAVAAASRGDE
jgi:hypothetical protein